MSRFGSEWLLHTKNYTGFETESRTYDEDELLGMKLSVFIAFTVTHNVEKELVDGTSYREPVSILSPSHSLCSDVLETWVPTLRITDRSCLPYQTHGGSNFKELNFEEYNACIQNALSTWHKDSFNELEDDEKEAVKSMKAHQLACFYRLMEEQDSLPCPISKPYSSHYYDDGVKFFLWQLGWHSNPFELGYDAFQEVVKDFLAPVPVPNAFLRPVFCDSWSPFGRDVLQASVHADNWLALESGQFPFTYAEWYSKFLMMRHENGE